MALMGSQLQVVFLASLTSMVFREFQTYCWLAYIPCIKVSHIPLIKSFLRKMHISHHNIKVVIDNNNIFYKGQSYLQVQPGTQRFRLIIQKYPYLKSSIDITQNKSLVVLLSYNCVFVQYVQFTSNSKMYPTSSFNTQMPVQRSIINLSKSYQ